MKTLISFGSPAHRSSSQLRVPVSIITILAGLGAVVAFWAPAYLAILDHLGGSFSARSEALGWSLFAVGAFGLGSVIYLAWRDTRNPTWRAAHGLPRHSRSDSTAH